MTAMKVRYGDFTFDVGEATVVRFHAQPEYNDRNRRRFTRTSLVLEGTIIDCDGEYDIDDRIAEIETAFAHNGYDLALLHTDESATRIYLRSQGNDIVIPTQVQLSTFLSGENSEYATSCKFRIVAQTLRTNEEGAGTFWFEEIIRIGTPAALVLPTMTQDGPVWETLWAESAVKYIQRGRAIGYDGYWLDESYLPLLPVNFMDILQTTWNPGSPKLMGPDPLSIYSYFDYPFEWKFVYYMPASVDVFPRAR